MRKWAERQIHWFIKQGQKISVRDGIRLHYCLKMNLGEENKAWKTQFVMSSNPSTQLPQSTKHGGVKTICTVESRLNSAGMKLKNRHWYQFRPPFWRAGFDVKVMVGSADPKFQIWGKDGCTSKDHEEIEVQWDPSPVLKLEPGPLAKVTGAYT
ncbi:hypothetical protein LTR70_010308 [Exophiala xenobiotica]|uniref:Uncharacterized protein n=1 Tax=Lithohypha guttulata TaxID=1690604 RepID=A0ABR0JW82_9EURO|nr:hypothetical protein LTR24_009711 [Lithohypha guttulata]KAK5309417.1 hypothetical protein LTR70_010308 [Exophiala xenobiotica]